MSGNRWNIVREIGGFEVSKKKVFTKQFYFFLLGFRYIPSISILQKKFIFRAIIMPYNYLIILQQVFSSLNLRLPIFSFSASNSCSKVKFICTCSLAFQIGHIRLYLVRLTRKSFHRKICVGVFPQTLSCHQFLGLQRVVFHYLMLFVGLKAFKMQPLVVGRKPDRSYPSGVQETYIFLVRPVDQF